MGTEVKVADAASQKQGRPCMEVALRLPSYPPTQPTHPPRSSVFVPCCLQAMERPGRPLFSLSGLTVAVLHVRSLCSTPGVAAGGGRERGEFALQREQNVHAKRWSSTSRSSDRKAQEIAEA